MVARRYKYMAKDGQKKWLYKRPTPEGGWFVRAFGTKILKEAELLWPQKNAEYESLHGRVRAIKKYADKDDRRKKFWESVARFLIYKRAGNYGKLPYPPEYEVPTETRELSHPFTHVRSDFKRWAREHDPEALEVYELGDAKRDKLFELGLIGSYFTMRELERLESE